jgi:hypothetical protein
VWPSAQVDQIATLVHGHTLSVLDFPIDHRLLERVGFEHLKGLIFGQNQSLELLVVAANLLRHFFDCGIVFL